MDWKEVVSLEDGPRKTAAICAWVQALYPLGTEPPILVGGAAVELYTKGAYTTGDLDFVGFVPSTVSKSLEESGFLRQGRHWIHEESQVFLEFPGSALAPGERAVPLRFGPHRVQVVSIEDLIVDRLASWTFWDSTVDAAGAFLLLRRQKRRIDLDRLGAMAKLREVGKALEILLKFDRSRRGRAVSEKELALWAESALTK